MSKIFGELEGGNSQRSVPAWHTDIPKKLRHSI